MSGTSTTRVAAGLLLIFALAPAAPGSGGQGPTTQLHQPTPDPRHLQFVIDGPAVPAPPAVISRDDAGRATIRAVRAETPIRIDGVLDDALYDLVLPISDFIQVEPQEGAPATEKTDLWLAFDDQHIYLAFRCWDSTPDRRVATEMRRDSGTTWNGNDVVSFFIDPFYDRRNGVGFTINSIGGRNDGQITNERQYAGDWNPIWDFSVGRFEGGWTVEVALPFKSIRYRAGSTQIWGFNALRTNRWKNELSTVARIPPGRGMQSVQQASMAATVVGIEAPAGARNLDVKPYATTSLVSDANARPRVINDLNGDIGLDVKYGVTQNLIADLTYNTDFAQVEADEAQVNLTRFSLFFPEKREFFLENQGTFSFGGVATSGQNAGAGDTPVLFYSRRIGLDGGRVVPIQAGGRLTGRVGRYSLGLLNIQTGPEASASVEPANFSVLRVKRDILRRSSVGLLFTGRSARQGEGGLDGTVGLDATFGFFNDLSINAYWARTGTEGPGGADTSYRAQLDYAGDRYGVQVEHLLVGDRFNPAVGFLRRDDMRRSSGQVRFSPRPRAIRSVRRFSWIGSTAYIENTSGRLETREQGAEFAIEFQNADRFSVGYTGTHEFLPRPFPIARGVTLPIGAYDFDMVRVGWDLGQQRGISANLLAERGTFYNGRRTTVSASRGRMSLGPQLSLEPTYSVNWVTLTQGAFTTHLAGSRITFTATPRMFASALLQYSSGLDVVTANLRLRWEYRPGSEIFVVYNEERDTRARAFPTMSTRSLIVKANRLLRF
jgi:hypothetical protein